MMSTYDVNLVFLMVWASFTFLSLIGFFTTKFILGKKLTHEAHKVWAVIIFVSLAGFAFCGVIVGASTLLLLK